MAICLNNQTSRFIASLQLRTALRPAQPARPKPSRLAPLVTITLALPLLAAVMLMIESAGAIG